MIRLLASIFGNGAVAAIFGIGGMAALVHIYGQDLPSHGELVDYEPAMLSRVYSGEGEVVAEFAEQRRLFVPIGEVPPLVKNAFISAEDKNFYSHPGVDALGIVKAIARYGQARLAGRDVRLSGASTITQQVMKNFLVGNARSLERKIKEAILAVRIDGALSKDEILELYLNEIFFGARAYGVAAAAQTYFGKPLAELAPEEAAYLAALPKAPSNLHPVRDRADAVARRNYVLGEMRDNGHLAPAAAEAAMDAPLETLIDRDVADPLARPEGDYFTAELRRQLVDGMGADRVFRGGLAIRATVDRELQTLAGRVLRDRLEDFDRGQGVYRGAYAVAETVRDGSAEDWRAALEAVGAPTDIPGWRPAVVLSSDGEGATVGVQGLPGDGTARIALAREDWIDRVATGAGATAPRPGRADGIWRPGDVVFVSREGAEAPWRLRQIPKLQGAFMAMDPHTGRVLALQGGFSFQDSVFNRATQARRQPGSAFKPFVYAAALDAGYSPSTTVLDAPVVVRLTDGDWRPKNSSGEFYGPTPLRLGLILSRNLMTVRIAREIGMARVAEYAERFGVYSDMPHHLSYALGAGETTLYDMVAAYGMFANGGRRVRPTLVDRIQDREGETVFAHAPRHCEGCRGSGAAPDAPPALYDTRDRIMNPVTAQQLVDMMQGVVREGTAARTVGDLGFPVGGKTGTTNENRDAWFIGFSPNLVAGCFIGHDTPETIGRRAYGGTMCGPVFKAFMTEAMEGRPAGSFPGPEEGEMVTVKIDALTGERLPDDATGEDVEVHRFEAGAAPVLSADAGRIGEGDSVPDDGGIGPLPGLEEGAGQGGDGAPDGDGAPETGGGGAPQMPAGDGDDIGAGTGGLY